MKTCSKLLTLLAATCISTGVAARGQEDAGQSPPPPPLTQEEPADEESVPFYSQLKPHGAWTQVTPFGFAWRPYVAMTNPRWKPYYDGGKWIWRDDAWHWQSEYEWGAIPFHYGRWMLSKTIGWVWVPNREWAPAWVCWRHTPTDYQWAPLPVEKSACIGMEFNSDKGFAFAFSLTEEHFVSAPRRTFVKSTSWSVPSRYISDAPPIAVYSPPVAVECYTPPVVVVSTPHRPDRYSDRHRDHHRSERHVSPRRDCDTPRPTLERSQPAKPVARPPERVKRDEPRPSATDRRTSRIQEIIARSRK